MTTRPPRVSGAAPGSTKPLWLSIIIPAYNEAERLPGTLREIAAWAETHDRSVEVIVVENGSTDGTADVAATFAADHPLVRVIPDVAKGKGNAVRSGMLSARGSVRFLCDADLSMPIAMVERFIPVVADGRTVAVGSREAPGARRIGEPAYRHFMGRIFNQMVKILAVPGIQDTQCGFKMFPSAAVDDVFDAARMGGWGFDAEVLYLARKRGYSLREVPIDWHYNDDSRVRPVQDSLAMLRDLLLIRWNDLRGRYDK